MTGPLSRILLRLKAVLTLLTLLVIGGIAAYFAIPKEAQPSINIPVYFVSVGQQGLSPKEADRLLVRPLESRLRSIRGLEELTSHAFQNGATLVMEFSTARSPQDILTDIRDRAEEAKAALPTDASVPRVAETNFSQRPTLVVTLSGKVPTRTLLRHAVELQSELEAIDSVRQVSIKDQRPELLEVVLNLAKLQSYGISPEQLLRALSRYNVPVAAGVLDDSSARFSIDVASLIERPDEVRSIPIKRGQNALISLGDVAEIRRSLKDPSTFTRVNGEPAIAIEIVKRVGANVIENNQQVRQSVTRLAEEWPTPVNVNFMLDQSSFIDEVQESLQQSIGTAIVLVMIVVLGTMGWRSGLLVGLALPISFACAFLILSLLGMTVNMMVLFALILTVGMLVDGAIVVTEYADRRISQGVPRSLAYSQAAQRMLWPVLSSTATTLAAFLPLLFWPGISGEFMSYFPLTVIVVLTASLLTALIFLPALGTSLPFVVGLLAGVSTAFVGYGLLRKFFSELVTYEALMSSMPILTAPLLTSLFGIAFYTAYRMCSERTKSIDPTGGDELFKKPQVCSTTNLSNGAYGRMLRPLTGNLLGNLWALVVIALLMGSIFGLFVSNSSGVQFFVDEEPHDAMVLVSARGNLSAKQSRDIVIEVEQLVSSVAGVESVLMRSKPPDGRRITDPLSGVQNKPRDVIGEIHIELSDFCCRRKADEIFSEIRNRASSLAGIKVELRKIEGGPRTGKDLHLQVSASNYQDIAATVEKVRSRFNVTPGLKDIEDDRPLPGITWALKIQRDVAGRYDADFSAISDMLQLITDGVLIGSFRSDHSLEETEIRVRLPRQVRSLDTLDAMNLQTSNGHVPLANFVERFAAPKVAVISRKDGRYTMEVKANLDTQSKSDQGAPTAQEIQHNIQNWLDQQTWPGSIIFEFKGQNEERQESRAFLTKAFLVALALMFIILLIHFNSFYQSVVILSMPVLAGFGVLLGLAVTGQKFSIIMTGTGVLALAGIVVNNAIILVDTFNRLRHGGVDVHTAIKDMAAQRLRPIMLTTVTTVLGLVPLALQLNFNLTEQTIYVGSITSNWWVQFATAVIFGLAFSTILTLVLVPVLLSIPHNFSAALPRLRREDRRPDTCQSMDFESVANTVGQIVHPNVISMR